MGRWPRALPLVSGALLFCWLFRCAEPAAEAPEYPAARGEPVTFSFGTTTGEIVDSAGTLGSATAVLFVTTFDLASQAQARYLNELLKAHRPRPKAVAVVLEPPVHGVLAEAFRSTLGLDYPVALANPSTLDGTGPFGRIDGVPTLVVLDRRGRIVFENAGAVTKERMDQALSAADASRMLPNQ